MPQMSPLLWLNLMITFIILMMMMNTLNYFSLMYKKKFFNYNLKKNNWKW